MKDNIPFKFEVTKVNAPVTCDYLYFIKIVVTHGELVAHTLFPCDPHVDIEAFLKGMEDSLNALLKECE